MTDNNITHAILFLILAKLYEEVPLMCTFWFIMSLILFYLTRRESW